MFRTCDISIIFIDLFRFLNHCLFSPFQQNSLEACVAFFVFYFVVYSLSHSIKLHENSMLIRMAYLVNCIKFVSLKISHTKSLRNTAAFIVVVMPKVINPSKATKPHTKKKQHSRTIHGLPITSQSTKKTAKAVRKIFLLGRD